MNAIERIANIWQLIETGKALGKDTASLEAKIKVLQDRLDKVKIVGV